MHSPHRTGATAPAVRVALFAITALLALMIVPAASLGASGGLGLNPSSSGGGGGGGGESGTCKKKAKLLSNGKAAAPSCAPTRVKRAIKAANKISRTKYVYGGGHGSFQSKGYDCSGAVSYMLHGAGVLSTPLTSGSLAGWGSERKGKWISVYANSGHVYAIVAGLRWDTSGGAGPRWHSDKRSPRGFTVRHPRGL